ncbi:MAG: ketopantoate reductase family protein [Phycisphaeraceae bacterium]|nr:ketopantoate reductase family protein [Phycisphaerales bacterium]MCB9858845.1 ketopantoate reductase family protein [Phycisphaeraceae bacterium]
MEASTKHHTDTFEDNWTMQRVAVIGSSSMGTLLAAVLGQVCPVIVVSRNTERASSLFRDGVRCTGHIQCNSHPVVVRSCADIPAAGGADVVFVATKTTAIPSIAAELAPVLRASSRNDRSAHVVSFQNGIEPGEQLMSLMPECQVLRMVLTLGVSLEEENGCTAAHIHTNQPPHAIGGPTTLDRHVSEHIAAALTRGGLDTQHTDAIDQAVWKKAIVNAAMNPVAALVNCTVGEVLDSPAFDVVIRLLREGIEVATAEGIELGASFEQHAIETMQGARDHTPSMVEDIRKGRESEVGQLNRQIIRHASSTSLCVPTHEIVNGLIETFDWKAYKEV